MPDTCGPGSVTSTPPLKAARASPFSTNRLLEPKGALPATLTGISAPLPPIDRGDSKTIPSPTRKYLLPNPSPFSKDSNRTLLASMEAHTQKRVVEVQVRKSRGRHRDILVHEDRAGGHHDRLPDLTVRPASKESGGESGVEVRGVAGLEDVAFQHRSVQGLGIDGIGTRGQPLKSCSFRLLPKGRR